MIGRFAIKVHGGGPLTHHETADEAKAALTNILPLGTQITWTQNRTTGDWAGWINDRVAYTIERIGP